MITIASALEPPGGPPGDNALVAPLDFATAPRSVGPFCMIAHHRSPAVPPGVMPVDADVRPHPHIGLTAVSYILEGAITHRDSLGNRCELLAGDIGVTVSGRGVTHSERFERLRLLGGRLEMFQLLLSLPDGAEDIEPSFFKRSLEERPVTRAGGATTRWLFAAPPEVPAGLALTAPVLLADVSLESDATWAAPVVPERALYVWSGEIEIDGQRVTAGSIAVAKGDSEIHVRAKQGDARLLAFGGTSPGPRYSWWNYMHSSLERIEAAKAEWRAGRVKLPVGDTESFTPAPPDDGRPLRHLNAR